MRNHPVDIHNARLLRQAASPAETWLWEQLRSRRFHGLRFRRRPVLRGLAASFACPERRTVLQIDSPDPRTDAGFGRLGIVTLHLTEAEILDDPDAALDRIARKLLP
ncbi:endonuclease domain-containing protein [Mangrovicoccus sp. HB161399]|uniref:endonuclease domain-containing protein n=1 Tax=Mangrovicoccus sp. HB161399 TaxID=2720392 RepID=UPI001554B0EB|nr:DUF559 domain-containing protein [Mangrovicoccus sp. HB161399]